MRKPDIAERLHLYKVRAEETMSVPSGVIRGAFAKGFLARRTATARLRPVFDDGAEQCSCLDQGFNKALVVLALTVIITLDVGRARFNYTEWMHSLVGLVPLPDTG